MSMMNANAAATTAMTANKPLDFELPEIGEAEFSSEELAEDMDGLTMSFPRIKIPAGGVLQFEIPNGDPQHPDYSPTLTGVILFSHASCAYWPEGDEYSDDVPPLCSSVDGKQGYGEPGGVCETCALSQFGSASNGRGKACKNMRVLYLLRSGEFMPLAINLSPTSISPFREFLNQGFAFRKRAIYGSLVEIGLKRQTNPEGKDYSVATFKRLGDFHGDQLASVRKYALSFREQIRGMNRQRIEAKREQDDGLCEVESYTAAPAAADDSFNFETDVGIALIREYLGMRPYLMESIPPGQYSGSTLVLSVGTDHRSRGPHINDFLRLTRRKYWNALFHNDKFMGKLTSELRQKYYDMVGKLVNYDFTLFNIQQISLEMNAELSQGIQDTIFKLFERFTVEHSWYPETSKNVHYFNGWKANKAHKVNSKIILPVNGMFSDYSWSDAFEVSHAEACISDIEKVFDFLDGNMTSYVNLHGVLARAARAGQTRNIPCKYFDVTLYKKGTMHIRFHNEELLERFNIYCSRGKNWLPPNYGKRTYADMPQEEQAVIDSFHGNGEPASGKERYAEILAKRDYYLQAPKQDFPLLTN